ncbi:hypothetical protein M0R04_11560 [Candidatus Dojkabacteria bacterium]|jgi:hypothetical protein|nr:hypothetical protein [Candidatus Dojkabacteria bacterium]
MNLESMSDEELAALASEPEVSVEQPTQEVSTASTENPLGEFPGAVLTKGQSQSFISGVNAAIPGSNQIMGALGAITDGGEGNFGERYEKNKADWQTAQEAARIDNPTIFGVGEQIGDIGGFTVANTILPGSGVLKNAATLGSWTFGKEAGSHPDQSLGQSLQKASVDTIVGLAAGKVIEKAGSAAIPYVQKLADSTAAHWLTDNVGKAWGVFDSHAAKYYNSSAKLPKEVATSKYIESLRNYVVEGKPLLNPDSTVHSISQGAEKLQEKYGNRIGKYIQANDKPVDAEQIFNKLSNGKKITSLLNSKEVEVNGAADEALKFAFFKEKVVTQASKDAPAITELVPRKITLSELHDLKRSWASQSKLLQKEAAGASPTANASMQATELKNRVGMLSEIIKDSLPDDQAWSTMNKKWADMNALNDITAIKGDGMHGGSIFSKIKKMSSTVASGGVGLAAYSMGVPMQGALAIGAASKYVLGSGEVLSPKLANGLGNLAHYMEKVPGSPIAMRAAAALNGNMENFHTVMMGAVSELNLKQSPLDRNNTDLKNRSDDVLQVMQESAPELTGALRKAINEDNEEGMAAAMEQLAKHPSAKGLIKDGQGWNGKVRDPADKAAMESQISGMNVSHRQKLELKKALNLQGTIPVVKEEQPYYINYKARDKGAPAY